MTGYRCRLTVFTLSVVVGLEPCEGEACCSLFGHFFLIRGGGRGCKSRFARAFIVRAVNVDRWMGFLQTLIQVWCSSSFRLGEATLGLQCFFSLLSHLPCQALLDPQVFLWRGPLELSFATLLVTRRWIHSLCHGWTRLRARFGPIRLGEASFSLFRRHPC